jgi:hypothetical protein
MTGRSREGATPSRGDVAPAETESQHAYTQGGSGGSSAPTERRFGGAVMGKKKDKKTKKTEKKDKKTTKAKSAQDAPSAVATAVAPSVSPRRKKN